MSDKATYKSSFCTQLSLPINTIISQHFRNYVTTLKIADCGEMTKSRFSLWQKKLKQSINRWNQFLQNLVHINKVIDTNMSYIWNISETSLNIMSQFRMADRALYKSSSAHFHCVFKVTVFLLRVHCNNRHNWFATYRICWSFETKVQSFLSKGF